MSANHAKNFDTRKASAEETARWLLPEVQRAEGRGSMRYRSRSGT